MGSENTSLLPIEQLFGSSQLFCLPCDRPVGMILQLPHYADFVGYGAAVGGSFDLKCVSVYPIGDFQFSIPETPQQRQLAFQRRLAYMRTLHRITFIQSPIQRAALMVRQLSQWLTQEEAQKIPCELIGKLIGVLPRTVEAGWQQHLRNPDVHSAPTTVEPISPLGRIATSRPKCHVRTADRANIIAEPQVKISLVP